MSDLFGRKTTLISALSLFTTFSLACGLARSMEMLYVFLFLFTFTTQSSSFRCLSDSIIFRAFQGIGGAGLYSLAISVIAEVTPIQHAGLAVGMMSSVFAVASLLGPILGGAITSHTTWRWVFYLNLPPGVVISILVIAVFPRNAGPLPTTWATIQGIDFIGIATSLAGSVLLIFALESGGTFYAWDSGTIVACFVVAALCFIAFGTWQWFLCRSSLNRRILPLFPTNLVTQRFSGLAILYVAVSAY